MYILPLNFFANRRLHLPDTEPRQT